MSRHIRNDDLLRLFVEAVVNPEAAGRVACVAAILDMPVGREFPSTPIEVICVRAAGRISNTFFDNGLPQAGIPPSDTAVPTRGRKPKQAPSNRFSIAK